MVMINTRKAKSMNRIALCFLMLACGFIAGCAVGVEPLGAAPVSYTNPGYGTAERTYAPVEAERREENSELNKDWEAGGRPEPAGGWHPYWEYY